MLPNVQSSRRSFLALLAGGVTPAFLGSKATASQLPTAPQNVRVGSGKQVVRQSDFEYIGKFAIPPQAGGADAGWGRALTHRYVDGVLRFYAMTVWGSVYQFAFPGLGASSYPTATIDWVWGDVTGGKMWTSSGTPELQGLYWDESDRRLYWTYANGYNGSSGADPSLGYSVLNDSARTVASFGVWSFGSRSCKACNYGLLAIPDWFESAYCPGKRLGVGFGGYQSVAATGPAHLGPALAAFAPPNPVANASRSSLGSVALVGYPLGKPSQTDRCHRDTDYTDDMPELDGVSWSPRNGTGFFQWSDYIRQTGVWVDTPTKTGVLVGATLSNGRCWYDTVHGNKLAAERGSYGLFVYDPMDLAVVARGAKKEWQIQPCSSWLLPEPPPIGRWDNGNGEPRTMLSGATFDSTTGRLFLMVRLAENANAPMVYVYQLQ